MWWPSTREKKIKCKLCGCRFHEIHYQQHLSYDCVGFLEHPAPAASADSRQSYGDNEFKDDVAEYFDDSTFFATG